jgi:membrane protease YdiL (CAAX protease family)
METKQSIGYKVWYFPFTRMVVGFIACFVAMSLVTALIGEIFPKGLYEDWDSLALHAASAVSITIAYVFVYRAYEKRQIKELSMRNLGRNLGLGCLLGGGLLSLVMLVIYLTGSMRVAAVNPIAYMLPAFAIGISSGIVEEVLFRGILFRISEEWLGSYAALLISGLIFGLLHASNQGANTISTANVALAGMLLAATYMYSRNLWLPIALHFSWNFMQGGVYGAAISGERLDKSLLRTYIRGNELITGGAFGPEASVQAVVFLLVAFLAFMLISKHKGEIMPPSWKRSKATNETSITEVPTA